jgi:peptidoglycan-associated lipoprotein
MKRKLRAGLATMLAIALFAGCGGKKQEPIPEPTTPIMAPEPPPPPPPPEPVREPPKVLMQGDLSDVFYDFDKATLKPEARNKLTANGGKLLEATDTRILIEGHCDERGTVEYNLALGERRARAAMDFLVNYGVEAYRIDIVSYGENKPFAMGHDEAAWAKNRRAHFVVKN